MNFEKIAEAMNMIEWELQKGPVNYEELNDLRKMLLYKAMHIETMQIHERAA